MLMPESCEKCLKNISKGHQEDLDFQRKELISQFLKDLTYIDTVNIPSTSPTNVFVRIYKIKEKWEMK